MQLCIFCCLKSYSICILNVILGVFVCQELEDIEVRLRHGGLGGVPNFDAWTKKLANASTVQDFVSIWRRHNLEFILR